MDIGKPVDGPKAKRGAEGFASIAGASRSAVMGLAILAVMLFHQHFLYALPFKAFHVFGYWGVEVFMFLSGMGIAKSLEKGGLAGFYLRRAARIFPACALAGSAKLAVFAAAGATLSGIAAATHAGWWSVLGFDLWFIDAILLMYLFSPLMAIAAKKRPVLSLAVLCAVHAAAVWAFKAKIGHDWFSPLGVCVWTIDRLPVYFLGMCVASHPKFASRRALAVSSALVPPCLALCALPRAGALWIRTGSLLLAFATPSIVFLLAKLCEAAGKTPPVRAAMEMAGRSSLELYVVHEFVFWAFVSYFNGKFPAWALFAAGFASAFAAAAAVRAVCSLVPSPKRR